MNDDISQRLWFSSIHTGDPLFAEAADEIDRLRSLVAELVPYMLLDVRSGLELGTPTADCCDNCSDCDRYAEAMDWVRRIESGELGEVKFAFFP